MTHAECYTTGRFMRCKVHAFTFYVFVKNEVLRAEYLEKTVFFVRAASVNDISFQGKYTNFLNNPFAIGQFTTIKISTTSIYDVPFSKIAKILPSRQFTFIRTSFIKFTFPRPRLADAAQFTMENPRSEHNLPAGEQIAKKLPIRRVYRAGTISH